MDLGKAPTQGTVEAIVYTAMITTIIVGVFGKRLAEFLLRLWILPFVSLNRVVYRWIAPRNPLSISLRTYRKHLLRSNLTRLENPVGASVTIDLKQAFAPLKLISKATDVRIDLYEYAEKATRTVVLGGPGTGKTTLMKSLVLHNLAPRSLKIIPVFVVLRNLAKNQHSIFQAVVAAFADHHFPGADHFVESSLEAGRLLIVLDGLDEVGASREFVVQQILDFCNFDDQRTRKNQLYVTCREHSYRSQDLAVAIPNVLQVEPFGSHHMRIFLKGWPKFQNRYAIELYALIQDDAQIRDICRNPLLLTILTGLYLVEEKFDLPASRQQFYQEAIHELMESRPARRAIKQTFRPEIKRQVLERVALERLEDFISTEDPEEFTLSAIKKQADALFQEKYDVHELVKELVDINGILRPSKDDSYTCAHRTIQEYFAAREATRRRTVEDVVSAFGQRPELIEVLYFYCSLIDNIPSLSNIIDTFISKKQWIIAGRALANMREPPNSEIVITVGSEIASMVASGAETKSALETLSALASRKDASFEGASRIFNSSIDRLASRDESGASALETAISAAPEIALKLIPGMLAHQSPRWKDAALQLLGDIGTDDALDQLVRLLNSNEEYIRQGAALRLAGLLRTRSAEINDRSALLPDHRDRCIWSLSDFFADNIMISMATALAPIDKLTGNSAVDAATRAVRGIKKNSDKIFLRQWRCAGRDARLQQLGRKLGMAIRRFVMITAVSFISLIFLLNLTINKGILISPPPDVFSIIPGERISLVKEKSSVIVEEIKLAVPPNASGWARILPWNWSVEPALPESGQQAYEAIERWSRGTFNVSALPAEVAALGALGSVVSEARMSELKNSVKPLLMATSKCTRTPCVFLSFSGFQWQLLTMIFPIISLAMLGFSNRRDGEFLHRTGASNWVQSADFLTFMLVFMTLYPITSWSGTWHLHQAPFTILIFLLLVSMVLIHLRLPINPQLAVLSDLLKPSGAESGRLRSTT